MNRLLDRRDFLGLAIGSASLVISSQAPAQAATTRGPIYSLPASRTRRFAWTIDDGASSASVRGYLKQALVRPELKYTFFVTSSNPAWRQNKSLIRELLHRGQLDLGNHTRGHPNLVRLSNHQIQTQLLDCEKFIEDEFQINPRPFFRPPYGYWDQRVLRVAADTGYSAPIMWYGTMNTEQPHLTVTRLLYNIDKWVANGRIVIDHSNNTFLVDHFDRAYAAIKEKGLETVRIRDAFPTLSTSW